MDEFLDNLSKRTEDIEDVVDCYGVRVDFENDEYERTHKAQDFIDHEDFNSIMPWAGMRRCTVLNGNVTSYYGDVNFKEDGSKGDVMVEIPKFYYRVNPIKLESAPNGGQQIVAGEWIISNKKSDLFKVHPAFIRNGVEVDHVYVGAYEAVLFDASANKYVEGYDLAPVASEDGIGSVKGYQPFCGSNFNHNAIRIMIDNRKDSRYAPLDFLTVSAIQMLYLVEYANCKSQETIGVGIHNQTALTTINNTLPTGMTSDFGNESGETKEGHVSYRGIENLWGNAWNTIGGIVINSLTQEIYWTDMFLSNDVHQNHHKIDFKICYDTGFVSRIGYDLNNDFCFLPTEALGSSNTGLTDVFNAQPAYDGALIFGIGGSYQDGYRCGIFAINSNLRAYSGGPNLTSRIQFYK